MIPQLLFLTEPLSLVTMGETFRSSKNQGNNSKRIEEDDRVLIVDDDVDICNVLAQIISRPGMRVETTSNPLEVPDLVRNVFFNLILLDIEMPGKSGMELLPEIAEISPDTKIIIISGFGDMELAIRSLRLGAFDFLEKPINYKLMSHSIERALQTQKAQLAYRDEKMKLQDANKQLVETNNALSTLARNIERTRKDTEATIAQKIRVSILPIIEGLQQGNGFSRDDQRELNLLQDLVESLTSTLSVHQGLSTPLTLTELRIAVLIGEDLTTNEIARHMNISPETVKTHRKNIRKKLNINNTHHKLRAHLQDALVR